MVYIVDAVLVMKGGGNGVVQWGGESSQLSNDYWEVNLCS